jgi:flagellar hook-associated protein 2
MAIDSSPILSLIGPSGLDTGAIIDALASVRRNPIRRLEAQRTRLQKQNTEFSTLRTKLEALRAKAASLDTAAELRALSAVSTDPTVLTAVVGSGANEGTYNITVNNLAESESKIATGVAEKTGLAIGSGIISITAAGGVKYDVDIGANADLESIKNAINASEAPVTASIIDDGSGTNPYKLVLTSEGTGAASAFSVSLTGFTSHVGTFDVSNLTTGQDASFTFNGVPVTRSTNTVTDIVPGLTFTLLKEGGSSTVTVTKDREAVKNKIKELVSAFNDVIDLFRAHSNADLKDTTAVLYGDNTLRAAQSTIRGVIDSKVTGTSSQYDSLAALGIRTGADGRLSVDDAALTNALNADFDGVISLFTTTSNGIANQAQTAALNFQTNSLKVRTDGIRSRLNDIGKQVSQLETRLDKYIESLRKKYAALDTLVGRLQSQGSALSALGQ